MLSVKEIYKAHYEQQRSWTDPEMSKYEWAANHVFDLTTYDGDLDELFVKCIVDILKVIRDRSNFEYIKDEDNYIGFIIVCQLLDKFHWIDWGTSIRGAWFDSYHPRHEVRPILEEMEWSQWDDEKKEFIEHKIHGVIFTEDNIKDLIEFLEE